MTPNRNLTIGTRLVLTKDNGGVAPTGTWMTLVETSSWDGADWWRAETDNGVSVWLRADGHILAEAYIDLTP